MGLNSIQNIQPILKLVAFSEDINIVFDFNQTSISKMDPTKSEAVRGTTYYSSGYIYIGANNTNDAYGTLAHEFAHYAMNLVYENDCKPYHRSDDYSKKKYEKVLNDTKEYLLKKNKSDPIVSVVFELNPTLWEAELIVRVPHLLAKYQEEPTILESLAKQFSGIFSYYNKKVLEDLKSYEDVAKSKKLIAKINQSGSLLNLIKNEIDHFDEDFGTELSQHDDVFNVISSNFPMMTLTMLYKSLERNHKSCHVYLDVESIVNKEKLKERIRTAFNTDPKHMIVIDCVDRLKKYEKEISDFLGSFKSKRKIVLIVNNKEAYRIKKEAIAKNHHHLIHTWKGVKESYRQKLLESFA